MLTKESGRQEPTCALVDFSFDELTDNTREVMIDLPADATLIEGLFILDEPFNSVTTDTFVLGDADDDDRYCAVPGSEAFTAAANDLLTTNNDYADVLAVKVSTTASAPGGLVHGTTYFALNIDATHIKLALTEGGDPIDLTSAGKGAFTLADASEVPTFTDEVFTPTQVAYEGATDNQITVGQDITAGTPLLFTVAKDLPSPLLEDTVYFVSRQGASTMKLLDAPGGNIIDIADAGSGDHRVYAVLVAFKPTGKVTGKPLTMLWNGTGTAPTKGRGRIFAKYIQGGREDFFQR